MAFEYEFEGSVGSGSSYCHSKYIIRSNGWSGKVIKTSSDTQEDRTFKFHGYMTISGSQEGTLETLENAFVERNETYVSYIGISLEHFGEYYHQNWANEHRNQITGMTPLGLTTEFSHAVPAYGAKSVDSAPSFNADGIISEGYTNNIEHQTYGPTRVVNIAIGTVSGYRGLMSCEMKPYNGGGWVYDLTVEIETDLPIFETDEDLMVYCNSRGEDTSTIQNVSDPEEEYELDQKYYFLHNIFTHNYHGTKTTYWRNYRWKPGYNSKIRLYRTKPSDSRYYTLVLVVPGGLSRLKGPKGEYTDEDAFEADSDTLQTHYCEYSFTISRVAPKDVMTVTDFDTNIPIWNSYEDATKYANDELSIEDAANYTDILRFENELKAPDWGTEDAETETGINGQVYSAGSAIYVLTRSEMIQFFTEIFKIQDPTFINAFKDGNVLFGDNQANAIIGCMYYPFDASLVCSLESSSGAIWVGGWQSQNATGKKVNYNDKTITVGEFQMTDIFKDVRDYEPYTNLYVQLPYCGTYQLSIQKYLNKTVKIEYAVDIFTGACTALIFANNILIDSMDGMIGSQRPVTGRTAANLLSAITKGSGSVVAGAAGGMKAAGLASALGSTSSTIIGSLPAFGANIGGGAMIGGAHVAAAGTALGAAGVGLAGVGLAGVGAVAGVDAMYKAKNAYADPPMASRGQYSGNLGMFANQQVHFIVAIRHTIRPENELNLIGYPSGKSGKIGEFSGYLKSSCVYLADGFIGSAQERNEILEMIAKGIYV